ncbi:AbrB family transcriptional regulator [Pseudophaeobacter sp.]|uniref:AbrB family transcriptional regulator n=1 Tax=Pseudophaeobacter sp. TaxID=1971739 RepID=UPI003297D63C
MALRKPFFTFGSKFMQNKTAQYLQLALILGAGVIGAMAAQWLGLPIPYLLGSMSASAIVSLTTYSRSGEKLWFPLQLRHVFIAVIGIMIGTTFSPEALKTAPILAITLCAMMLFVCAAQILNFGIFHHIGGYDRVTAKYAAMPGGLIEAVTLGEKADGDVETMSIQHFVRIVLVIMFVPTLFQIFSGETVGSAASQTLESSPSDWTDWLFCAVFAPVGIWLGARLKLPASHLMGPLLLTALLHAVMAVDIQGPSALLNLAQLIVGAGLGVNFARSTLCHLLSAFALGFLSVSTTLIMASGFAYLLASVVPMSFTALLISFAPGGVTEMSLVALSLGVAPVLVTTHHLFRIIFTVTIAGILTARSERLGKGNPGS